jgi:hypothetical protein
MADQLQAAFTRWLDALREERATDHGWLTVAGLLEQLAEYPAEWKLTCDVAERPVAVSYAHSYRGYYAELAFEPAGWELGTVDDFMEELSEAIGSTYEGWKGGEFTMGLDTHVFLAYEGTTGRPVTGVAGNTAEQMVILTTSED